MKIQNTYLLYACFIIFPLCGIAQNDGLIVDKLSSKSNRLEGKITGETYYVNSKENNYYFLQKDWVHADILLEDGNVAKDIQIRYKAFNDELVAYNEANKILYIVDKKIVKEFYYTENGKAHKYVKIYQDGVFPGFRYFEEMYQGNNLLLAFRNIKEVKVSPYNDRQGILRDTEYRRNVTYYHYSEKTGFSKINFRRKSLFNLNPERKKEIRKTIRKNKIFLNDETSLLQVFKLLDKEGLLN